MTNDMHAAEGLEPAACSGQRVSNTYTGAGARERAARIEMHAAEGSEPTACSGRRAHDTLSGFVRRNERAARIETARPAAARSGGAIPPSGIVPGPAASHPLAGEGTSAAGMDVSSLNLAPAVSDGCRGLFQRGKPWAPDLPRLKALIAEGKTYAECAEILGRTRSAIENVVDRRKLGKLKKWTAEEMRVLLDRRLQAHPIPDIAASLGRTPQSVEYKWGLLARRLPASVVARVREQVRHNVGRKRA